MSCCKKPRSIVGVAPLMKKDGRAVKARHGLNAGNLSREMTGFPHFICLVQDSVSEMPLVNFDDVVWFNVILWFDATDYCTAGFLAYDICIVLERAV